MAATNSEVWQRAVVTQATTIADEIQRIVIETSLPAKADPGSHIDVMVVVDGQREKRSYSIVEASPDGRYLTISVFRAPASRGGSVFMHTLSPGDTIEIGCRIIEPGAPTGPAGFAAGPVAPSPKREDYRRRLLWWVRDSGPGIPPGEEESIFQRFHTARGQLRDGRGGTGLGLAIVSTIAKAHGGRAFAFNAEGGGAVFCIVVPLIAPPPETRPRDDGDAEPVASGDSGTR